MRENLAYGATFLRRGLANPGGTDFFHELGLKQLFWLAKCTPKKVSILPPAEKSRNRKCSF
jgi:hypothetical protein